MTSWIARIIKGMIIALGFILPGVSGGVLAAILGIYERIIRFLAHIRENFDAVWIPTYGTDSGYYNAAPNTDLDYDLHQYTSQGRLNGFKHALDLNIVTTLKDPNEVYQRLFTVPEK